MVDPSRIRHRITEISIDRIQSSDALVFIDFRAQGALRWYVSFCPTRRTFNGGTKEGSTRRIPRRLTDYLVSIIPPAVLAECIAVSLGAADPS